LPAGDGRAANIHRFVSTASGSYFLKAGDGHLFEGSYTFDLDTSTVKDSKLGAVGTFTCEPLFEPFPLGLDEPGTADLPCVGVAIGEIMSEVQKEANNGAYFVIPSLLNGVEYANQASVVTNVDDYRSRGTVGSRGQLAVHPAVGQFLLDNAACEGREDGICAIDEVVRLSGQAGVQLLFVNGHLQVPVPETSEHAMEMLRVFAAHLHMLRILVMEKVPPCGLSPDFGGFVSAAHHVNFVYASTSIADACVDHAAGAACHLLHCGVAESMLVAQYYGALRAAARRPADVNKCLVFLTTLRSSVFNNPLESIARSVSLSVEMLTEAERARLDIRLFVSHNEPDDARALTDLLQGHRKLLVAGAVTPTVSVALIQEFVQKTKAEAAAKSQAEEERKRLAKLERERRRKEMADMQVPPLTIFVFLPVSGELLEKLQLRPHQSIKQLQQEVAIMASLPLLPRLYFSGGTEALSGEASLREAGIVNLAELVVGIVPAIATASQDGTAKIWDAETGSCERTLLGHMGTVCSAQWSPNSRFVVTASEDGTAKVYNSRTGACERTFEGHTDAVYAAAFASDSLMVVTGSADGTARIWTAKMEDCLKTLKGHNGAVYSVSFDERIETVFTYSRDGTTKFWSVRTGICDRTINYGQEPQYDISYSIDGLQFVSVTGDRTPKIMCVKTGSCLRLLEGVAEHEDLVLSARYAPDIDVSFVGTGSPEEAADDEGTLQLSFPRVEGVADRSG